MAVPIILTEEAIFLLLLAIAIIASIVLARIRFPYTVGLVVIGYLLAAYVAPNIALLSPLAGFALSSDVILFLFLPPLIFEAAISINSRLLSINILPVMVLAVLGLVLSTGVVGVLLTFVSPLPLLFALLFGALISATDPVAVIAIFRELGVPRKLRALVEGESLFNDASAIVTFNLILGLIVLQEEMGGSSFLVFPAQFATNFLISFVGGIVIGAPMALAVYAAIRSSPNHPHIHQTVSIVVAYSAFIIGQAVLNVSGVIAVVSAGIVVSRLTSENLGVGHWQELARFWGYIGHLADTLIFLLVGLSITRLEDPRLFTPGFLLATILVILAVLAARGISVFGLIPLLNRIQKDHRIPFLYQTVIFWGGLRGAIALALVLSLSATLPYRDLLVGFTLVVVIFSILVQGTTIGTLIKRGRLSRPPSVRQFEKLWLNIQIRKRAIQSLTEARSRPEQILPEHIIMSKVSDLTADLQSLRHEFSLFWETMEHEARSQSIRIFIRIAALDYERDEYVRMFRAGLIPGRILDQMLYYLEIRYDHLQISGTLPGQDMFFSPLARIVRHIEPWLGILPGFKPFIERRKQRDRREDIVRSFTLFSVARNMMDWIQDLSDDIGIDKSMLEYLIQEYNRTYQSARSDFSDLVRKSPELLEEIYSYMAERVALFSEKNLLAELGEGGFLKEQTIEAAMDLVEREEIRVSRKMRRE